MNKMPEQKKEERKSKYRDKQKLLHKYSDSGESQLIEDTDLMIYTDEYLHNQYGKEIEENNNRTIKVNQR